QQNPEPNPEFASYGDPGLTEALLHQLAPVETAQVFILAYCVHRRLAPEEAQQRVALFAQSAQPLSATTGVFTRDDTRIAGQRFAVSKPRWIAQEHFRR